MCMYSKYNLYVRIINKTLYEIIAKYKNSRSNKDFLKHYVSFSCNFDHVSRMQLSKLPASRLWMVTLMPTV